MDKTDRLRDYGLAFLLYEQGLGVCGYELIRELFIFVKLILNSYLKLYSDVKENKKGRILQPFIRHITERYALYIQRQALPRIPSQAISDESSDLISDDSNKGSG